MSRQDINVAFVGGGRGCYNILLHLRSYPFVHFKPHVIGVADIRPDAVGRIHAESLGIPTFSDYKSFLRNEELDLIIELTGKDDVLADIISNKLPRIKVLDHVGALFLWEIIAIQEEKLRLEKKVSQLDTMAAIGEISFRMTHELRNPLMIIGGQIRRMMTRVDLPHGCRKKLKQISYHVQEIENLLSDICDVVRPLKMNFSLVDMSDFFTNWRKAVKAEAELAGIELKTEIDDDLPDMYIDKSLMRQALWHIFENCYDAMAGTGGKLIIKVLLCWDNIHIQFIDTGGGFKNLTNKEALQPFISSKPGQMGLGLALCSQIILEHGGDMEILDREQTGTTVIIKLPIWLTRPNWFVDKNIVANKPESTKI